MSVTSLTLWTIAIIDGISAHRSRPNIMSSYAGELKVIIIIIIIMKYILMVHN